MMSSNSIIRFGGASIIEDKYIKFIHTALTANNEFEQSPPAATVSSASSSKMNTLFYDAWVMILRALHSAWGVAWALIYLVADTSIEADWLLMVT